MHWGYKHGRVPHPSAALLSPICEFATNLIGTSSAEPNSLALSSVLRLSRMRSIIVLTGLIALAMAKGISDETRSATETDTEYEYPMPSSGTSYTLRKKRMNANKARSEYNRSHYHSIRLSRPHLIQHPPHTLRLKSRSSNFHRRMLNTTHDGNVYANHPHRYRHPLAPRQRHQRHRSKLVGAIAAAVRTQPFLQHDNARQQCCGTAGVVAGVDSAACE